MAPGILAVVVAVGLLAWYVAARNPADASERAQRESRGALRVLVLLVLMLALLVAALILDALGVPYVGFAALVTLLGFVALVYLAPWVAGLLGRRRDARSGGTPN